MSERFIRFAIVALLLLLAALVAQPYIADILFATSSPRTVTPRGSLTEAEQSTVALFERVAPSVVQVIGQEQNGVKSGSGFVWDAAGHIVTNNHVVDGVTAIAVQFASGESVAADIVGRAPNYDLAVLRVSGGARLPNPLAIGSSGDLKVGQSAFAIGNPFGLDQSLTSGIVSALKRRLPESGGREISDVIQTDAAINPGNSGGPLLDSAGRVIGVNTAIFSPSGANAGIGFAIPVDVVNRVVPQLIRNGRMPTPGIGIMAADEATAARLHVSGVIIAQTVPGSPAERAGLKGIDTESATLGDVITKVDGKPVRRLADLTDELVTVGIGNTVHVTIERGGRSRTVDVKVTDLGES
ncbi:MAG: trypsin-like peptidase domain-containing protein [Methylobacteriaceae bacterium]|nr:trypsin-like peptidase domain-containing protein [Methylobacteriaceae bacterium]